MERDADSDRSSEQLVVGFECWFQQAVFDRSLTSQSNINLDLIQPLLRGGGRAVTLEPLTQNERNLLYEIRLFARFREQFFANITTGGDLSLFNVQPVRQGFLPTLLR